METSISRVNQALIVHAALIKQAVCCLRPRSTRLDTQAITTGRIEHALQNRRLPDRGLVLRRLLHGRRLGDCRVARRADLLRDLRPGVEGHVAAQSSSGRQDAWISDAADASCARRRGDRMTFRSAAIDGGEVTLRVNSVDFALSRPCPLTPRKRPQ